MVQLKCYSYIYLEELRKITSNLATAAGFLNESRTKQFPKQAPIPNQTLERYRYTNLLGWQFVLLHLAAHTVEQSSRAVDGRSPGQEILRPDLIIFTVFAATTMLLLFCYYYYYYHHNLVVIISVIITTYLHKYNCHIAKGCVMLVRSLGCFCEPSTLVAFMASIFIENSFKIK
jgi:hypothetical protein